MAVPEDYDVRFRPMDSLGKVRVWSVWIHDVMQQELPFPNFHHLGLPPVEPGVVGVPAHGCHWGNILQLINDFRQTDIAGVQNVIDTGEQGWDLGIKEIMRIRNDADFH